MKFLRENLGLQLWALYLLLVFPVIISLVIFDRVAGERIQKDVIASDLALARAIAQETQFTLKNALSAVRQLGEQPAVLRADPAGMDEIFSLMTLARLDVSLIYRLDAAGWMVYHYPTGPVSTVGRDFSFREYFRRAQNQKTPLFSEGRVSPTTNQVVATAVMPLYTADNRFLGVVAANIQMESLSQTLREILAAHSPDEAFQIFIIDHTGHIVAHPQEEYLLLAASEIIPEFPKLPDASIAPGSSILRSHSGEQYLYAYAPIPSANWSVIVRRPTSAAFAEQISLHQITLLTLALFVAVGLLFWLALSLRVIRPIEQLARVSQAMSENQPVSLFEREKLLHLANRPDQIGHLIRVLTRMENTIAARMNEQNILLETSQAVVSSLDTDTVLNRILEQVERLVNVKKIVILALDQLSGAFRIRASRGFSSNYTEKINIAPDDPLSVTMRAIRSGEPQQVNDTENDPSYEPFRESAREEGYRSLLAVPLKTQYHAPAALVVFHAHVHQFGAEEIRLLVSFANHAAMAIENAALFARSESRRREQTRRIEALIQSLDEGLALSDLEGNIVYANRRAAELSNLLPSELSGVQLERALARVLSNAVEPEKARDEALAALNSKQLRREVEIPLNVNGRNTYLLLSFFDVTNARGVSIGQGVILRDITPDRELDRMKSGLISTVSHELRTPLAAIKGYASTLLAEDVEWDSAAQREFLEIISSESDRLGNLVNNLLDLSRIEAGSLNIQRLECNIEDLVQRAALRGSLQESNRLMLEIEPGLPPFYADPQRMETILRNLVENAVKYAGPEAEIRISVTRRSDKLIFRVEDDGPGIPPEESGRIFESFYQVDNRLTRTSSGSGLGLSICQGFVRAHGGEIWVEPSPRGACIAFYIPLETVPA
ncbi:MAG: hypothetical protein OHK0031_04760 [Anaerolineales bacterium]